jgi:hypothetical protein
VCKVLCEHKFLLISFIYLHGCFPVLGEGGGDGTELCFGYSKAWNTTYNAFAPLSRATRGPRGNELGLCSTKKEKTNSSYSNSISWQLHEGSGDKPAEVSVARGSLKGSQIHKFKEWNRISMATKYFFVKQPGISLTAVTFNLETLNTSQIESCHTLLKEAQASFTAVC